MTIDPDAGDSPFNDVISVELDAGKEAVISYEPEDRRSEFYVRTVAISKAAQTAYRIDTDGTNEFNGDIPPTDIDDLDQTFFPPESFEDHMEIVITNSSDATRIYHIQVIGWESRRVVDEREGRGF